MGGETLYLEKGLLLLISSSRSQGVPTLASPCKLIRDAYGRLRAPRSTAILCTLSKSHCMVLIPWSPSGYTPVQPECPDHAVLFTNQNVTVCQAHRVTRKEPKIHGICYITFSSQVFLPNSFSAICSLGALSPTAKERVYQAYWEYSKCVILGTKQYSFQKFYISTPTLETHAIIQKQIHVIHTAWLTAFGFHKLINMFFIY